MPDPIDLYFWPTPNGWKVSIALEEMGLPYRCHLVDIGAGDQHKPEFLRISPNNRIPAIADPDGPDGAPVNIFESGAILLYLARKTGRFMGESARDRIAVEEWLMWQMGGVGPMAGQAHHFLKFAPEDIPYAKDRYRGEVARLYGVLDRRLARTRHVAGDFYSIADMAIWPWYSRIIEGGAYNDADTFLDGASYTNVARWTKLVGARPTVRRGQMVNKAMGNPAMQLRERHNASDFETKTQDKLEAAE